MSRFGRLICVAGAMLGLSACAASAFAAPGASRGWRAYPNPFSLRFRVEAPESLVFPQTAEARIRVFDMRGHMVRHWTYVVLGHEMVIDWDEKTDAGAAAPSGWYVFDIQFKNWGARGLRFKMLRIRGAASSTYDQSWF